MTQFSRLKSYTILLFKVTRKISKVHIHPSQIPGFLLIFLFLHGLTYTMALTQSVSDAAVSTRGHYDITGLSIHCNTVININGG